MKGKDTIIKEKSSPRQAAHWRKEVEKRNQVNSWPWKLANSYMAEEEGGGGIGKSELRLWPESVSKTRKGNVRLFSVTRGNVQTHSALDGSSVTACSVLHL